MVEQKTSRQLERALQPGAEAPRADSEFARRARWFHSGNAFNLKLPAVPRHIFLAERDRAFDPASPTGFIPLDLSAALNAPFPCTLPLVLTGYVRVRAGESLATRFQAATEIFVALQGEGRIENGGDAIEWRAGDVVLMPGGGETTHRAGSEDAVLWAVNDEPYLRFADAAPPARSAAPVEPTHFRAEEIRDQLMKVHAMPGAEALAGFALLLSSAKMERRRSIAPLMTLALNSLPGGLVQRPHRHNAAALTLCVAGERCHSVIEGERVDWSRHAVMVTPPGEMHAHHNEGDDLMLSWVIQDGGLHYHTRTMDFAYAD